MKSTELRIGNLVIDGLETVSVNSRMIYMLETNQAEFDNIPITEEWLLKFGFKKREDGDFDLFNFSEVDIVITNPNNSNVWKCNGVCFSVGCLEHVHQLQNLYFALTGEELKSTSDAHQ